MKIILVYLEHLDRFLSASYYKSAFRHMWDLRLRLFHFLVEETTDLQTPTSELANLLPTDSGRVKCKTRLRDLSQDQKLPFYQ